MTKKTPNNDKHDTFLRYMKERTQYAERHKKTNWHGQDQAKDARLMTKLTLLRASTYDIDYEK